MLSLDLEMNYLAHLYLSCDNEDLLIGNFIADSINNKDLPDFNKEIQKGVQLHRLIDTFTDSHPLVKQGTKRLHPFHHKYAPVVVDILYDHILAKNWKNFSGQTLEDFAQNVYEILDRRMDELPSKMARRVPGMIKGDWLVKYGTKEGLAYTFMKMDERTSFPSNFKDATDHVELYYKEFNSEFNQFFPEVIDYVEKECKC